MYGFFHWLDAYTDVIERFVANHVVLAPLLLLFAEEMGIPILVPGDAIIGYVGYRLSRTDTVALWEAYMVALVAVLGGASILFFVARRWGRQALSKLGRFIFLKESHLVRAEHYFARYGVWAIIFGRHIPGMRIPITIFAASSGVRYRVFLLATLVSTTAWILFYLLVGEHFGGNARQLAQHYAGLSLGLLIGLVVLVLALHVIGRYREHRGADTPPQ